MTETSPLWKAPTFWLMLVPAVAIMDGFVHVVVGSAIVTGALVAVHAVLLVLAGVSEHPPDHVV